VRSSRFILVVRDESRDHVSGITHVTLRVLNEVHAAVESERVGHGLAMSNRINQELACSVRRSLLTGAKGAHSAGRQVSVVELVGHGFILRIVSTSRSNPSLSTFRAPLRIFVRHLAKEKAFDIEGRYVPEYMV
jgi:hypothetical protein